MSNRIFFVLLLLVSLSPSAGAKEMVWEGTLEAQFNQLEPITFTGSGVATLNEGAPLEFVHLAGGITGSAVIPLTDPMVTATLKSVIVSVGIGTGALSPFAPMATPQLTQNTLPMAGQIRLCMIVANCASSLQIPLVTSNAEIGVGLGGTWTAGGYGNFRLSIESAPWTMLTATMVIELPGESEVTVSTFGVVHGPRSSEGSAGATGGIISVVVPIQIKGDFQMAGFSRLTLRFVPEPIIPLLLGSGLIGLVLLGRSRIRP